MENPNPIIVPTVAFRVKEEDRRVFGESDYEPIDALEVFDIVRDINDPEHPLTLEQLRVVHPDLIKVQDSTVILTFTPTIPHCSMATLIGLCLRIKLMRSLPRRFKIDVSITPGTHNSEEQINKQLRDKERVSAAIENKHLLEVVNTCLKPKARE